MSQKKRVKLNCLALSSHSEGIKKQDNPLVGLFGKHAGQKIGLSLWPKQRKGFREGFLRVVSFPAGLCMEDKWLKTAVQKNVMAVFSHCVE